MSQLSDALVVQEAVPIDMLLLDPQNPRFDTPVAVEEETFAATEVQEATMRQLALDQYGVHDLAESIRQLGFLPVDKIVVREFATPPGSSETEPSKYIVIEGNRRVAAIKLILVERMHRPITGDVEQSIATLDVLVLKPERCGMSATQAQDIIQGVRHISGVRGWGPYQQATALRNIISSSAVSGEAASRPPQAAAAVGLTPRDATIDLNALGAYEQMAGDDEYGSLANPRLFSYFVEAVKKPAIRAWLSFNPQSRQFDSEENRRLFFGWITVDETGFQKIRDAQDVRKLVQVLENAVALSALSNDDHVSIQDAYRMAETPPTPTTVDWQAVLQAFAARLDDFPVSHLSDAVDLSLLRRIDDAVTDLLDRAGSPES